MGRAITEAAPMEFHSLGLLGRESEVGWLEACLEQALSGRPLAAVVGGAAGIGKTRIVRELATRAEAAGFAVGIGTTPQDVHVPYLPIAAALRAALAHVRERAPVSDEELVFPFAMLELQASHLGSPHPVPDRDMRERQRLFAAVARCSIALARRMPLLLVIEDLHWLDATTMQLLLALWPALLEAAGLEPIPMVLLATHRCDELGRPEPNAEQLIREQDVRALELRGLDAVETAALLAQLGLPRLSQHWVLRVHEVTQGNPLFIEYVAEQLVRSPPDEGLAVSSSEVDAASLRLPETLSDAIRQRVAALGHRCRRVLALASCLDDRFDLAVLSALAATDALDAAAAIEEAGSLLVARGSALAFAHPFIRGVVYRLSSPGERAVFHARVATMLLARRDLDASQVIALGRHVLAARNELPEQIIVTHASAAGERALALFAWTDAATFYAAASTAAAACPQVGAKTRARYHYLAGLCHHHDWDWGPCFQQLSLALSQYRAIGDLAGAAEVSMLRTLCEQTMTPYGQLIDIREQQQLLAELGSEQPVVRGRLLEALSEAHWMAQQPVPAAALAEQALALGESAGDDTLSQYAAFGLGLALYQQSKLRPSLASFRRSLWHARRKQDVWLQNQPLQRIVMVLHALGEMDEASSAGLGAHELARQTNDIGELSLACGNLAVLAAARDELSAVERYAQAAARAAKRSEYPWGVAFALSALAGARCDRGHWQAARDAINLLLQPGTFFREVGATIQALGSIYLALIDVCSGAKTTGDRSPSLADYAAIISLAGHDAGALGPLCALIEMAHRLQRPDAVEQAHRVVAHALEHGVLMTNGWSFALPRVAGLSAALLGHHDEADTRFRHAVHLTRRLRTPAEFARASADYAAFLGTRETAGSSETVLALVTEALPIAMRLGLRPCAQQLRGVALLIGRPELADRSGSVPPDRLTQREAGILRQLAHGETESRIAEGLLVSSVTLSTEMAALYERIGVASRIGAIAYALDTGLVDNVAAPADQTLVILVTDLVGFTSLVERMGDLRAHQLIRRHNRILRDCLRAHAGTEIAHTGDGMIVSFAAPLRALHCAAEIHRRLQEHNRTHPEVALRVRIGVHAGRPLPEERRLFGTCVNTAVRICAVCEPEQLVASAAVRTLVSVPDSWSDEGLVELKGLTAPVHLYRVPWWELEPEADSLAV